MNTTTNDQPRTADQAPEIRVFISSTFRDMQHEREYLLKHIFPELRQICRDRGVQFTEIDLRWGVTREEAEQGKVLKICLDEINRCRPYFIGILGERYGWTPRFEDVQKDTELVDEHPWIEGAINDNISVTEMEILYGVLDNPSMDEHAFFYFRDPDHTDEAFKETERSLQLKLTDLKGRIRTSHYPVRENFESPEKLGQWVREDLLRVINEIYPEETAPTAMERERRVHEAFALTRRSSYVARQEYLDQLDDHAASEGQPLVIIGEPGSGKSALLAYWVHEHRRRHPDAFIIEHYVGATSSGGGHLAVITRIIEEIKDRYGIEEEVPSTPEALEREFPLWLARVQKEKMILILDALNQLSGSSNELRWMPRYFPPNVRTYLSTISGATREALRKRGWRQMLVDLLTEEEREKLIRHYLGKFRKALSPEQRTVIAADPNCANPLFLRTVLEELRIFGSFEQLDERINYYVSAADVSDLFQRVLGRLEEDYGARLVEDVLSLIWASRRGLSEPELMEMTSLSRMDLSSFMLALEYQLMQRGGLLDFYHDFLRDAVDARYYRNAESLDRYRSMHLRIAAYFEGEPISDRKADELPWQLQSAGETERLAACLADIPMFMEYAHEEKQYDLLAYWLGIGDLSVMEDRYRKSIQLIAAQNRPRPEVANIYTSLGNFFVRSGRFAAARPLLQESLDITVEWVQSDTETATKAHYALADLLRHIGEYSNAESLYRQSLSLLTNAGLIRTPTYITALRGLGLLLVNTGRYTQAESAYAEVLELARAVFGRDHTDTAKAINNLAVLLAEQGKTSNAESLYREALEILLQTAGPEHPDTAQTIYNLATTLYEQKHLDEAEQLFQQALSIWEKTFGQEHYDTATALNNLAVIYRHKGEFDVAEPLYRRTLDIWISLFGPDHLYSAMTLTNIAELLQDRKDFDRAEETYHQAHQIYEKAVGADHPYTAYALFGLGTLHRDKGEFSQAEIQFIRALEIREKALGDHPETAEILEEYAKILRAQERREEAATIDERLQTVRSNIGT